MFVNFIQSIKLYENQRKEGGWVDRISSEGKKTLEKMKAAET